MLQPSPAASPSRGGGGSNNDVAALLQRIDERLARVERAVERAEAAAAAAPGLAATAVDTLDGLAARAQARGVDLDQRITGALRLVERLTDPHTQHALESLLAFVEQAPGLVAAAVDTADGFADRARASGIDIDERLRILSRVAERLTSPEALGAVESMLAKVDSLQAVLASGVLDRRALATVATAGDALAKAASTPAAPMGLWGAFRASGDPEVQRALGFLVRFAHAFGADLHETPEDRRLVEAEIR